MRHLLILYLSNIYILNVDRFNFFIESNCHYRTSNICTWQMFRFFMSESILLCSHLLLIIPNVWGLFCFHMKVFVCFFCTEAPLHTMGDSCLSLMLLIKMGIDFKENSATRQRREGLKRFSSKRKYSLKDQLNPQTINSNIIGQEVLTLSNSSKIASSEAYKGQKELGNFIRNSSCRSLSTTNV